MQPTPGEDDKTIKAPTLLHSFAIIVLLLISISIFNFTIRSIFGSSLTSNERKPANLIFDPNFHRNWTSLCPTSTSVDKIIHNIKWRTSPCFNKTLLYWHIPWVRDWVWKKFDDITEERKRLKELEILKKHQELLTAQQQINAQHEVPVEDKDNEETNETDQVSMQKESKENPTSVVYTILTAMTLMLTILAGLELFREKFSKKPDEGQKDPDRRCSLAEFTIKRHLRKESQQENLQRQAAFDEPKKVKEFLHQGSLDRAISMLTPAVISRLPRQSSMPGSSSSFSDVKTGPSLQAIRTPSIDQSEEEGSPGMRRKSRHFIRRH